MFSINVTSASLSSKDRQRLWDHCLRVLLTATSGNQPGISRVRQAKRSFVATSRSASSDNVDEVSTNMNTFVSGVNSGRMISRLLAALSTRARTTATSSRAHLALCNSQSPWGHQLHRDRFRRLQHTDASRTETSSTQS